MKFNFMIPELTVSDINQTKDFYINKLGFHLEYERKKEKFVFLSYNESQFMFEQIHQTGWNIGELQYPFGRGINFSICASNVYELYQKVVSCDVKLFRELQEATYKCDKEEVKGGFLIASMVSLWQCPSNWTLLLETRLRRERLSMNTS